MSLVGTVVLALFGSRDLSSWAERLGGGPADQRALSLTAKWDQAMTALGLAAPHDALHSAFRRFLEYQWDNGP